MVSLMLALTHCEQTIKLSVIWEAMTLIWRHYSRSGALRPPIMHYSGRDNKNLSITTKSSRSSPHRGICWLEPIIWRPQGALKGCKSKWSRHDGAGGLAPWMHLICIHYRPTLSGPYACSRYKHKSREISFGHDVYHLNSDFEILYRARQYHCRALYKIWKWFSGLKLHQGRTSFHEICVSVVSCVLWIRLIYVWTRSWVVSLNRCQITERFCHPLHGKKHLRLYSLKR